MESQWTDWLVAIQIDVPVYEIARQNEYTGLCISDSKGGLCVQVDYDAVIGSKIVARRIKRSELTRLSTMPYSGIAISEAALVEEAAFNSVPA